MAPTAPDYRYRNAEQINREVFSILDRLDAEDSPFFLFINYMDAHLPLVPPAPFDTLFSGKAPNFSWTDIDSVLWEVNGLKRELRQAEHEQLVSQYDGAIAYLDAQLGRLFARLSGDGLMENTLIVVWSDHGESLGERQMLGHGLSLYQAEIGVPIVIRYPKQNAARVVSEAVSSIDLFPTILDAAGIEVPPGVSGRSLVEPRPSGSRIVISESFPSAQRARIHERFDRLARAIVDGRHKLIWFSDGHRELYDLAADSNESANMSGEAQETADSLEARLAAWLDSIEIAGPTDVELDKAAAQRLRALGYIR